MNKKVKELTLEQIKNICNEHYPSCRKNRKRCPLYHKTISCDTIISVIRSALRHNPDALEEEIEIVSQREKEKLALKIGKLAAERIEPIANVLKYYIDEGDNNE